MSRRKGDPTPVIGGCDIPSDLIDSPAPFGTPPDDDLGRQVFWLLSLHPDINLQFRDRDLCGMDDCTKRALLADIHAILGVQSLKATAH